MGITVTNGSANASSTFCILSFGQDTESVFAETNQWSLANVSHSFE